VERVGSGRPAFGRDGQVSTLVQAKRAHGQPPAACGGVAAATFIPFREGVISHPSRVGLSHESELGLAPSPNGDAQPAPAEDRKLDALVGDFARFINSEVALLCLLRGKDKAPTVVSSWGLGATHGELLRLLEGGLVGRAPPLPRAALAPLHPLLDSVLIQTTNPPLSHVVEASVRLPAGVAGRLIAGFATPPEARTQTLWAAEAYSALIALCVQDDRALDGLLAAGQRDDLTGCLTYQGTHRELEREINRSTRGDLPLAVCFIDLDNFKGINDARGHLRGNEVLALVGRILRDCVRSCDTVGRYGGDEFIAILPETNEVEARQVADRLRSRLARTTGPVLEHPLTASVGVAQWTPGTDSDALLSAADSALLTAKALRAGVLSASEAGARAA
jgi:diguanylate cyclase (GGDEF)-like protein